MKKKSWVQVHDGKIVLGPLIPPENYFSKSEKNSEVSAMDIVETGWLPVIDNSEEVDLSRFAVSESYKIEIFPDKVLKTHKIKEFPKEFIDAFNKAAGIKTSE